MAQAIGWRLCMQKLIGKKNIFSRDVSKNEMENRLEVSPNEISVSDRTAICFLSNKMFVKKYY